MNIRQQSDESSLDLRESYPSFIPAETTKEPLRPKHDFRQAEAMCIAWYTSTPLTTPEGGVVKALLSFFPILFGLWILPNLLQKMKDENMHYDAETAILHRIENLEHLGVGVSTQCYVVIKALCRDATAFQFSLNFRSFLIPTYHHLKFKPSFQQDCGRQHWCWTRKKRLIICATFLSQFARHCCTARKAKDGQKESPTAKASKLEMTVTKVLGRNKLPRVWVEDNLAISTVGHFFSLKKCWYTPYCKI